LANDPYEILDDREVGSTVISSFLVFLRGFTSDSGRLRITLMPTDPPSPSLRTYQFHVLLSEEEREYVNEMTFKTGLSRSAVMRTLLRMGIDTLNTSTALNMAAKRA
jgi:hypothetical protein